MMMVVYLHKETTNAPHKLQATHIETHLVNESVEAYGWYNEIATALEAWRKAATHRVHVITLCLDIYRLRSATWNHFLRSVT